MKTLLTVPISDHGASTWVKGPPRESPVSVLWLCLLESVMEPGYTFINILCWYNGTMRYVTNGLSLVQPQDRVLAHCCINYMMVDADARPH